MLKMLQFVGNCVCNCVNKVMPLQYILYKRYMKLSDRNMSQWIVSLRQKNLGEGIQASGDS